MELLARIRQRKRHHTLDATAYTAYGRGGKDMSERQEKKKRYNLRLMWIADFDKWLNREPPMWRVFAWRRWKRERPVWVEADDD